MNGAELDEVEAVGELVLGTEGVPLALNALSKLVPVVMDVTFLAGVRFLTGLSMAVTSLLVLL